MSSGLASIYLIENDINDDLIAWGYPSIDTGLEAILKERCCLTGPGSEAALGSFTVSRYDSKWQYFLSAPISVKNSKVVAASVVVIAQDYNVDKYESLLSILMDKYVSASLSMLPIQEVFVYVFSTGKVVADDGSVWEASKFDPRTSLVVPVHALIDILGLEIIRVWVAVLCKQRIVIHHTKPDELSRLARAIPAVGGWHRQAWSQLRPLTALSDAEVADLKAEGVYVAGVLDPAVQDRPDLWDVLIDVPARTLHINPKVKQAFLLGKYHKQVSESFIAAYEASGVPAGDFDDAAAAQVVIKAMAGKTKELLAQLQACKGEHEDGQYVSLADIQSKKLPSNMEGFLFNVAVAEGLTRPSA